MPDVFLRAGEASPADVRLRTPTPTNVTGTAAVAFGMTEAAAGTETFSGTIAVAFGMTEAAVGAETFSGTAAEAFGFSVSAAGATLNPVTGTAAVAFDFGVSGQANMPTGSGWGPSTDALPLGLRFEPFPGPVAPVIKPKPEPVVVGGYLDVAFGFGIASNVDVNDDELVLALT